MTMNILRALILSLAVTTAPQALARESQAGKPSISASIGGAVENRLVVDAAKLAAFPPAQIVELPLARNAGSASANYRAVRLRDLISKAVIVAPGRNDIKKMIVVATATDGYVAVFTWAELFNTATGDGVLVLFDRDGKPLPDDEGRIALISTKDIRTGARHVKWLQAVDVRKVGD